jgi:hypothetical protein
VFYLGNSSIHELFNFQTGLLNLFIHFLINFYSLLLAPFALETPKQLYPPTRLITTKRYLAQLRNGRFIGSQMSSYTTSIAFKGFYSRLRKGAAFALPIKLFSQGLRMNHRLWFTCLTEQA